MILKQVFLIFPLIVILAFAIFVYIKNKKSIINRYFSAFLCSVSIWASTHYVFHTTGPNSLDALILGSNYFFATLIPPFFYMFTNVFVYKKPIRWQDIILFFMSIVLFFYLYFFTEFMIKGVRYSIGTKIFIYGSWQFIFDVYFSALFLLSFQILLRAFKEAKGTAKLQIKYVIIGTLLSLLLSGGVNIILPDIFKNFKFAFAGPLLSFPMFAFISYAILAHQLMDINIVIRKTAIYSILVSIVTLAYFIVIYIMEGLFRGFMGYKSIPWTITVIAIFALIFQPLKNLIQSFIDKYFFKGSLLHEYEKAQDELKRTERLKAVGTLAAGMAHEIKNPLTGIKTFTEYLPQKRNDPEFLDKFHKIVTSEVNKINDIVQQLLNFSKPKLLQLEKTNIHTLLEQTLSFLSNDFIKYSIHVTKEYDYTLPLLNIDPNQMKQVFLNLFLNSIDAMKQGGTLTIATKLTQTNAEITIQDTGTGISKKDLEHIFDPFYSTKETGTGLGMSIVYGIIKEHKGGINVESEIGKGTVFRIRLQR